MVDPVREDWVASHHAHGSRLPCENGSRLYSTAHCAPVVDGLEAVGISAKVQYRWGIASGAKQAAEKFGCWIKSGEEYSTGAEARADFAGFMRGLKPPPPSVPSFSATYKARVHFSALAARLKSCPFKAAQTTNIATPAMNMAAVVIATTIHPRRELGWPCMSFRFPAITRIATSRKGASKPLMTAVQ